ncbi:MAG: hypothetical protein IJ512_07415 [Ruminococcus sp.]|nr:hypothetical protein [Ruminococcus sp.]
MVTRKRVIWLILMIVLVCMITFGAVSLREHTYWLEKGVAEEMSDTENTEASIVQWMA